MNRQPPATGTSDEALALNTFVKLMRAASAVSTRVHRYLTAEGLSASQFGILEALQHCGPLHQRVLGQKILKSSGNITVVVDHLEQRGLVARERNACDRRQVTVSLTAAGSLLIKRLFPVHRGQVVQALAPLSSSDQQVLGRLCKQLGLANTKALDGAGDHEEDVRCNV
jgi:MarR family transcriptional regulator, 2-MHQ and catechol-resistance regulon repressor